MKPGMGWPIAVVVILSATVAANIALMRVAGNDPSFAIEPDYYRKAVAFDTAMAQERRSADLRWTVSVAVAVPPTDGSAPASAAEVTRQLSVTLTDTLGTPIRGAAVNVAALYVARANDVITLMMGEVAPGVYRAVLPVRHAGQWDFRVEARRGSEHFVEHVRTDISLTGGRGR